MKKERSPYWRELKKLDEGVEQSFRKLGDQIDIMYDGTIVLTELLRKPETVGKLNVRPKGFHVVSSVGNPTIRGAHGLGEARQIADARLKRTKKDQWIYVLVEKVQL